MIKMAVIGAGLWAQEHGRIFNEMEGAAPVAICDLDRTRAEKFAAMFGIGDDQEIDVIGAEAEAFKRGPHILDSIDGQVDGARAAVVCGPLLDGLADRRIVDDG